MPDNKFLHSSIINDTKSIFNKYVSSFLDGDGNIQYNSHITLGKYSNIKDHSLSDKQYLQPSIISTTDLY